MYLSKYFLPTLREDPSEAELISHKLMLRAGMIRKLAAGIYNLLPLGLKVIRKVENIVREEMNRSGAQEVLMPIVTPAELWQASDRWELYGKELLRFKDRAERDFCLGPTHEEVITHMAKELRSYKQLPVNLYQIQTKFRDEIRPRFGVMRAREFIMKDAYSFHDSLDSLQQEYSNMHDTYCRIFDRCGVEYRIVEADSGSIGGAVSHEFMVVADSGEDAIAYCSACSYSANLETATSATIADSSKKEDLESLKEIHTPNTKTIDELVNFFKVSPTKFIKTLIYIADGQPIMVLIRGDLQLNELKLKKALNANELLLADNATIEKVTGATTGFAGPIGLTNNDLKVIADKHIANIQNAVTGANKSDYHFTGVNPGRDFSLPEIADLSLVRAEDLCPKCTKGTLAITRGIEVGHIFQLGTKYSQNMQAFYNTEDGQNKPFIMGCYGIGIGRTVAATIEQHHDQDGIIWPKELSPFDAVLIVTNTNDKSLMNAAEETYIKLQNQGQNVIIDDRNERPGVKFKDADLIGIPKKIIFGKSFSKGQVEIKTRYDKKTNIVDYKNL